MRTPTSGSPSGFIWLFVVSFAVLVCFSAQEAEAQTIKWQVPEETYLVYSDGERTLDSFWYEVNTKRPDPRLATGPSRIPFYMSLFLPNRSIRKPQGEDPVEYRFKRNVPLYNPVPPGLVMVEGERRSNKTVGEHEVIHLHHEITFKNKPPNQNCEKCVERNRPYFHASSGSVQADLYYDPELKGLRKISYDADLKFKGSFGTDATKEINERKTFKLVRHHKIGSNNLDSRVQKAVSRGVDYLLNKIDGNWSNLPGEPFKEGVHSLVLLTLLKTNHEKTSRNSELIKNGMRKLYKKKNFKMPGSDHKNSTQVLEKVDGLPMKFKRTYTIAIAMMAMKAYYEQPAEEKMSDFVKKLKGGNNPSGSGSKRQVRPMRPEDRKWMVKAMKKLFKCLNKDGRWGYCGGSGRDSPDNSNTQYGALGMYSALKSRMTAPPSGLKNAIKGWLNYQQKKGPKVEMALGGLEEDSTGVVRTAMARGWSYSSDEHPDDYHRAYDNLEDERVAMTAGGISSLQIYEQYLRKMDRLSGRVQQAVNRGIQDGLAWMSHNWTLRDVNYYELYALERAGMLTQLGMIGGHKWYPEGAELILTRQKEDGSWSDRDEELRVIANVCFALLFLKRATSPIVSTRK